MLFSKSKQNTPHYYLNFPGQYANKYEKHDWLWPNSGVKKMLSNRASPPPVNSTAETSGRTHKLLMHRLNCSPSKGLIETVY